MVENTVYTMWKDSPGQYTKNELVSIWKLYIKQEIAQLISIQEFHRKREEDYGMWIKMNKREYENHYDMLINSYHGEYIAYHDCCVIWHSKYDWVIDHYRKVEPRCFVTLVGFDHMARYRSNKQV